MVRVLFCLLLFLATGSFAKALVAVVETKADDDVLTRQEKMFLTDKLRSIANIVFSGNPNFSILTRENINVMLPPGKTLEDCEGSCLAETGRLIAADFIAQARVGRYSDKLSLTVEMYETRSGKLISSFTGQQYDADGLLADIEDNAESFFRKARGGNDEYSGYGGRDGFSDISTGSGYSYRREKSFIVQVESDPEGALLSIDGDPVSNCKETPCKVQLKSGSHRFSLVSDQYFKKDSIINITEGTSINFVLKPRFGILDMRPTFDKNFNGRSAVKVLIDDEAGEMGENRLTPGLHTLEVRHPCYEPLSAKVNINVGSELTFDRRMQVAKGGLSLTAVRDDEPVEESVYINGQYVGTTPFDGEVPVCASIAIGDNRDDVPVTILYHDETSYTYEFPSTRRNYSSGRYETKRRRTSSDDDSYEEYAPTPVSGGRRVSSSNDSPSFLNTLDSKFYFQMGGGVGFDMPFEQSGLDELGLMYSLDFYYTAAYMGFKMRSGIFMGVGAGLGLHGPRVMEDDNASSDYYYSVDADDINDEMPDMGIAILLSAEAGYDFLLDGNASMDVAAGVRASMILGDNLVLSVSGFMECLSWFGMELGFALIEDDYMNQTSPGFDFKIYARFPGRPKF